MLVNARARGVSAGLIRAGTVTSAATGASGVTTPWPKARLKSLSVTMPSPPDVSTRALDWCASVIRAAASRMLAIGGQNTAGRRYSLTGRCSAPNTPSLVTLALAGSRRSR